MRIYHVIKSDQWRFAPQIRPTPHFVVSPVHSIHRASDRHAMIKATSFDRSYHTTEQQIQPYYYCDYVLLIIVFLFFF